MDLPEGLKEKRGDILRVAASHGARDVWIFGSLARNIAGPTSDIDVLVALAPGRSRLDMIAIKQDLEDLLSCEVDVVTEAALSPYIRERVPRQAVGL